MKALISLTGSESMIISIKTELSFLGFPDFMKSSLKLDRENRQEIAIILSQNIFTVLKIFSSGSRVEILVRMNKESVFALEQSLEDLLAKYNLTSAEMRTADEQSIVPFSIYKINFNSRFKDQITEESKAGYLITDYICSRFLSTAKYGSVLTGKNIVMQHIKSETADSNNLKFRHESYLIQDIGQAESIIMVLIFSNGANFNSKDARLKPYFPFGLIGVKWLISRNGEVKDGELTNIVPFTTLDKLINLIPADFIIDYLKS